MYSCTNPRCPNLLSYPAVDDPKSLLLSKRLIGMNGSQACLTVSGMLNISKDICPLSEHWQETFSGFSEFHILVSGISARHLPVHPNSLWQGPFLSPLLAIFSVLSSCLYNSPLLHLTASEVH